MQEGPLLIQNISNDAIQNQIKNIKSDTLYLRVEAFLNQSWSSEALTTLVEVNPTHVKALKLS